MLQLLACVLSILSVDALAAPSNHHDSQYRCDTGARLEVTYTTAVDGDSTAMLEVDGKLYLMKQERAASGARYVADELVWWSKGNEGVLLKNGRVIHSNCQLLE
mgnify:CR=1 FL=1